MSIFTKIHSSPRQKGFLLFFRFLKLNFRPQWKAVAMFWKTAASQLSRCCWNQEERSSGALLSIDSTICFQTLNQCCFQLLFHSGIQFGSVSWIHHKFWMHLKMVYFPIILQNVIDPVIALSVFTCFTSIRRIYNYPPICIRELETCLSHFLTI